MKTHSRFRGHKLKHHHKLSGAILMMKRKRIRVGDIFESCDYHPLRCTYVNYYADDIRGVSLISGKEGCCSIWHCGVYRLTNERAQQLIDAYNAEGEVGLMVASGWTLADANQFMKDWPS